MNINRRDFIKASSGLLVLTTMPAISGFGNLTRNDLNDNATDAISKLLTRDEIEILRLASLSPSGHNAQPWVIRVIEPGKWMLGSSEQRWLPAVDPANRELTLSIGAFLNTLKTAALTKGYDADIETLSIDPRDTSIAEITLKKTTPSPFPIEKILMRRTIRNGITNKQVSAKDISFITSKMSDTFVFFPKGSKEASYIENATIEANRSQAYRQNAMVELSNWIRWSNSDARKYRNGLTPASMDIKGIAGWFVRHFYGRQNVLTPEFRTKSIEMATKQATNCGGWLLALSEKTDITSLISTGSDFMSMALRTRERNLGIHPMTQALEESPFKNSLAGGLGIKSNIQFILRTGYVNDYPDPVSLRMPVSWFVS